LGPVILARHWAEHDFKAYRIEFPVVKFQDLVKTLLADCGLRLLKDFILPFDHLPSHGPLALLVALHAGFKRHIEEHGNNWNLESFGQSQEFAASRRGQGRRVHHAKAVETKALLDQKMHQGKGLGVKALIPLVITYPSPCPIGGDDLGWPEMARGEGGFPAGRRSAQHDD
jgi:hypothetical protein